MKKKLKRYSEEFKQQIVALYEGSKRSAASLEREYDIGKGNVLRWHKQYGTQEEGAEDLHVRALPRSIEEERIRELERENAILRQERDILKKAIAIFSQAKGSDTGLSRSIDKNGR